VGRGPDPAAITLSILPLLLIIALACDLPTFLKETIQIFLSSSFNWPIIPPLPDLGGAVFKRRLSTPRTRFGLARYVATTCWTGKKWHTRLPRCWSAATAAKARTYLQGVATNRAARRGRFRLTPWLSSNGMGGVRDNEYRAALRALCFPARELVFEGERLVASWAVEGDHDFTP